MSEYRAAMPWRADVMVVLESLSVVRWSADSDDDVENRAIACVNSLMDASSSSAGLEPGMMK